VPVTAAGSPTPRPAPPATSGLERSPDRRAARDVTRQQIRSFGLIAIIFVVLLAIALTASWSAIEVVNITRSFATGEGRYSKAQKMAVFDLHRYAYSGLRRDYAAFRAATAIPRGDRAARLALEGTPVDLSAATAGLLQGNNHPDDIAGLIWMFRWFSWWGPFAAAVADWHEGDRLVGELIDVGVRLDERVVAGTLDPQSRERLLGDLDSIDDRLTALENAFSDHMGEASRTAKMLVVLGLSGTTILLWSIGMVFASRLFRQQLALDRQLSASEQRFRQLFEIASDYFFETDAQHRLISASSNYEAVVGLPVSADLGVRFADMPGAATDPEMKKMALLAQKEKRPIRDFVYSRRLPDGEIRWISASAVPVFGEDGEFRGLRGVGANVTARINAQAQLHHSQRLEALGMLAGGVAHELNNALVPVMALTKLVAGKLPDGSRERRNLDIVLLGAERSRDLVKKILAFSRREHEERRRESVDVGAVLQQALHLMRATLPASIRVEEEIAPTAPVAGDPNQLHQLIVNVMTNGAQAIGEAMGTIIVRLAPDSGGTQLRLSVIDTGCGMDDRTKSRIFEPFFTTKEVGRGTGLGLAVVHGMVKDHGGRIEVHSAPGQGTRVDVFLPVEAADLAAAQ
jgi:PAS domain S-box-containing protein